MVRTRFPSLSLIYLSVLPLSLSPSLSLPLSLSLSLSLSLLSVRVCVCACMCVWVCIVYLQASVVRVSATYDELSNKYHTEKSDNPNNSLAFN